MVTNKNEALKILEDDFEPHVTQDYGRGYFCTPDVFDKLQAILATPDPEPDARLRESLEKIRVIAEGTPELNMNNYDEGQVEELNDGMNEITHVVRAALAPTPTSRLTQTVEWISVEDRLPEEHASILISHGDTAEPGVYYGGHFRGITAHRRSEVTHWALALKSAQAMKGDA